MLRILHVLSTLSPRYGGPVQVCLELARRQAAAGHRVEIYTTNVDIPLSRGNLDVPVDRPVPQDGFEVRYFPVEFRPMLVSTAMHRALAKAVPAADIVHIHGVYRFPQLIAGHHARRTGVPYWVRPYGSLDPYLFFKKERRAPKRLFERLFVLKLLHRADAIHYTTEEERMKVSFLKLRAPPVVVPNGLSDAPFIDLPPRGRFRARHGLGDGPLILHFGRLTMKKGIDLLTAALGRISPQRPDLRLAIVGPDNEGFGVKVRAWVHEHGLDAVTVIPGMLEGEAKMEALRDADIFALPSYTENFGISVVEAMAAETPVVISNEVGIWREVAAHEAGLVVPCEVDALTGALTELLDDPARGRAMGERARRFALDFYAWEKIVPRIEAGYRATIAARESPARA